MKRLYFYRIFSLILVFAVLFFYSLYNNKSTTIVEVKKITNPNYVFLGDSITDFYDLDKYFPNVKKVNSGISGDKTADILKDMYNRVYKYNPSKVFLLIGINDIIHVDDSNYIATDIEEIAKNINKNLPNCEIYIESIYPINEECEKKVDVFSDSKALNKKIIDNNNKIKELCKKNNYTYVNVYKYLIDENEEGINKKYSDDGLHLNDTGYKIVTKVLKEYAID